MRFLRLADVRSKVGLSRSQIYRIVAAGDFPKPYSLGGRTVAWLESEIDSWIKNKVQAVAADARSGE
jgi:prophage regulatory protein